MMHPRGTMRKKKASTSPKWRQMRAIKMKKASHKARWIRYKIYDIYIYIFSSAPRANKYKTSQKLTTSSQLRQQRPAKLQNTFSFFSFFLHHIRNHPFSHTRTERRSQLDQIQKIAPKPTNHLVGGVQSTPFDVGELDGRVGALRLDIGGNTGGGGTLSSLDTGGRRRLV